MTSSTFYNRTRERHSLEQALQSRRAELLILYGRRGVGKSALLRQVLDDTKNGYLFYRAVRRTLPLQLEALTEAFRAAFPGVFLPQTFSSTSVFLDSLTYEADRRENAGDPAPVCVVIDELPYLADVDPGFLTALQHWWDDNKRRPNLKLFLAGSWLSFMERQVLDERAPLYNRRTGAMKLEPLDYAEAGLFFPSYTDEQKLVAYAVLGGMPSYLEQFQPQLSIKENLLATALRANTYLAQEPDWLLLEDLRRDVLHGSVLRAIAHGERKPSDIARAIGKDSAQDISPQLSTLQELGLIVREVPITEKGQPRSRNSLYFVADHYLNFWYRFVDPARSLVTQGLGEQVWERSIAPNLSQFVSKPAFEWASRDYLWRAARVNTLPSGLHFTEVGTWWGGGDIEIDVLALDEKREPVTAGSCKWTNEPMGLSELDALRRDLARAGLEREGQYYFLFSRSGFNAPLVEYAKSQPAVILVDLGVMFSV
ncbi:ATP-binding protein [Armatimonas sp.]|uniref:ATP-binding protein n=1 Tax=Armatimonas sp. TaxID=1872638 RepID=UPI00374FFD13